MILLFPPDLVHIDCLGKEKRRKKQAAISLEFSIRATAKKAKFSRFDAVASFSVMDVWWHHSTEKRVSLNKSGSPTDLKVTIYGGSGNLTTTQPVLL